MDHQRIPQPVPYWEVPRLREGQIGQGQTGEAPSRKTYEDRDYGLIWEEAETVDRQEWCRSVTHTDAG